MVIIVITMALLIIMTEWGLYHALIYVVLYFFLFSLPAEGILLGWFPCWTCKWGICSVRNVFLLGSATKVFWLLTLMTKIHSSFACIPWLVTADDADSHSFLFLKASLPQWTFSWSCHWPSWGPSWSHRGATFLLSPKKLK